MPFEFSLDSPEKFIDDMAERYERLSDVSDKKERLRKATEYFIICRPDLDTLLERLKEWPDYEKGF